MSGLLAGTRVPRATIALIGLNVLAALLASLDRSIAPELGFDPANPSALAALASLFLHANLVHLLGNMVLLAAAGPAVEFATSGWRVAALYLCGGLGGVGAHWAVAATGGPGSVLLGASSGAAALAGFAALRFARVRVPVFPGLGVAVSWIALVWVLLQAAGGFVSFGKFGGVSFVGHIAGFLVGVAAGLLASAHGAESKDFGHSVLDEMNQRGPGAVLAATDSLLKQDPGDLRALLARAEALGRLGEASQRVEVLAQAANSGFTEEARTAALLLVGSGEGHRVPSHARLRLAGLDGDEAGARSLLASVAEDAADPARPEALLALARLQEGEDRARTLAVLQEEYALHGATEAARRLGLLP